EGQGGGRRGAPLRQGLAARRRRAGGVAVLIGVPAAAPQYVPGVASGAPHEAELARLCGLRSLKRRSRLRSTERRLRVLYGRRAGESQPGRGAKRSPYLSCSALSFSSRASAPVSRTCWIGPPRKGAKP